MPTITAVPVTGYASCRNALCPGYHEEEVPALREETSFTFGELGGDGVFKHMEERSVVEHKFADETDAPCPGCGRERICSGEPRPQYEGLSGFDPMGLLNVPKFNAAQQAEAVAVAGTPGESDEEIESRLRAKLREEQIEARLRAELDKG